MDELQVKLDQLAERQIGGASFPALGSSPDRHFDQVAVTLDSSQDTSLGEYPVVIFGDAPPHVMRRSFPAPPMLLVNQPAILIEAETGHEVALEHVATNRSQNNLIDNDGSTGMQVDILRSTR